MHLLMSEADGMLVVDQARRRNCGVVTDRLRAELACLAEAHADKIIVADSRDYLEYFTSVILKSNLSEALRAAGLNRLEGESAAACADRCGRILSARSHHPVVITLGSEGIYLLQGADQASIHIPAISVHGPIDIVGAGDSVNASVGAALCAGSSLEESGFLGNLVASIVIQQIGVTGTATPSQVMNQYQIHFEG
jgi:bifunctional ADP-heptose synthase (sugar kinase/adenylyltransferase)